MVDGEVPIVSMGGLGAEMFRSCNALQQRWLTEYCKHGDAERASTSAGVPHLEAMVWIRDDPEFAEAMDQARRVVGLDLEASALQKARSDEGSDRLIIELLKAMMPERYDPAFRDTQDEEEYDGGFGGGINVHPEEDEQDAV